MKQMKTILPQWNRTNLNAINENFKGITDFLDEMGEIPTNADLIVIKPTAVTDVPNTYPIGITSFYEVMENDNGKAWEQAVGGVGQTTGWRIQVETTRTSLATTQRVTIVETWPSTKKLLGIFFRAAYNNIWGAFERQDYKYTASASGTLFAPLSNRNAIEIDYNTKTLTIAKDPSLLLFRDGYRWIRGGANTQLPEDIVLPFSELGSTQYVYLFCKRVYENPEDNLEGAYKILNGMDITKQNAELTEKWCYIGFFKTNAEIVSFPGSEVLVVSKKDKKVNNISFLGDSITTYSGQIPAGNAVFYPKTYMANLADCWWKQLIDYSKSRLKLLVNNSWSGSRVTGASTSISSGVYRADLLHSEAEDPDVIIVYLGINDFNNNVDLGTYDGTGTFPTETTTFSDAYAIMLNKMTQRYSSAKIYCCTLPFNNKGGFPRKNTKGILLDEYNERIRLISRFFGAEVIELDKLGINPNNVDTFLGDGLHPNVAGMDLIFKKAKEVMGL